MISNIKTFRKIIAGIYPNINNEQVRMFDDGWDYVVFVLDGQKAFRFPRRPDYAKKLPVEVSFLDYFRNLSPVTIPNLTFHTDKITGLPYVTYDFISGIQFTKNVSNTFSKEELRQIARQIGGLLDKLHSFPIDRAKKLDVKQVESLKTWRNKLEKIKQTVFPYIARTEQNWSILIFENFFKTVQANPMPLAVIHSDIMPEHIIVNPGTHALSGIIDFGDVEIGDPAYDFAFIAKYGKDFLNWAYETYNRPKDLGFEIRRQFYLDRLALTNLEHSIEQNDKVMTERHKTELSDYLSQQAE